MVGDKELGWLEAKTSGGAVFEQGVRQSKEAKAIRRLAQPLMDKHWKDSVTNLHRIYRVAEYLYKRSKRNKRKETNHGRGRQRSPHPLGM